MEFKQSWISEKRFEPYLHCTWECKERAVELYLLDRQLSASMFQDISYIEVALRNAINRYLSETYGDSWYSQTIGFDKRVRENISESWESLPSRFTSANVDRGASLGGRLVAASMFRTWTNMLDKGGSTGLDAPFDWADHDEIWTSDALKKVFPGANALAKQQDKNYETYGLKRAWVYQKVFPVRQIRNRIAHHESLSPKGVAITGAETRLTPEQCYEQCIDLAQMLDRDLAEFLAHLSTPQLLQELASFIDAL